MKGQQRVLAVSKCLDVFGFSGVVAVMNGFSRMTADSHEGGQRV
jgi:hypothetical protein